MRAAPPEATATAGAAGTAATGTTGTAGAAGAVTSSASDAANAKFVLADASVSPATAGTTTAPGNSSAARAPQTYQLIANAAALSPHVGKKIELTGTLVDPPASAPSASTPATAAGPTLRVESGKVIAASCQE